MGRFPARQTVLRFAVGVMVVFAIAIVGARSRHAKELPVYVKAAERFVAGEQVYVIESKAFSYPPLFVLPFMLLLPFPPAVREVLWWAANLGSLIAVIGLVAAMIRPALPPNRRERVIYAVVVGVLSAKFLLLPLGHQSHDLIVLLSVLLSAHFAAQGRQIASGGLAGIAAALKATPLLLLPYFLWRRMWLAATAMVGIGIAGTLLPDVISPNPDGQLWVRSWNDSFVSKVSVAEAPDVKGAWAAWNPLNQSLAGSIHRWFTPPPRDGEGINVSLVTLSTETIQRITLILQMLVLLPIAWSTRRVRPGTALEVPAGEHTLAHYGMLLCGMLLLSPMSSTPHFCALLVPVAVLACEAFRRPRNRVALAGVGVLFFVGTLSARDLIGRFLADRIQALGGATLCTAVCLVFVAWVARNWIPAPPSPPRPAGQGTASG